MDGTVPAREGVNQVKGYGEQLLVVELLDHLLEQRKDVIVRKRFAGPLRLDVRIFDRRIDKPQRR